MKVSNFVLALTAASGAIAGPLRKRVMETEIVTETYFTTVTVGNGVQGTYLSVPAPSPSSVFETPSAPATSEVPTTFVQSTTSVETPAEATPETTEAPAETTPETTQAPAETTPVEETTTSTTSAESTTSSTSTSSDSSDPFIAASLNHHNIHRSNHSAPDVAWDAEIASYAAITAKTCTFAHDVETGGGGYGQNIAMWASSTDVRETGAEVFIGRTITEMWYNGEIELYPSGAYGSEPDMTNFHAWGHYSQVVWVETTHVGCAVQYCEPGTMVDGMGSYFSVCNYSPPGNMGGGYAENVLAPLGQATVHAD